MASGRGECQGEAADSAHSQGGWFAVDDASDENSEDPIGAFLPAVTHRVESGLTGIRSRFVRSPTDSDAASRSSSE